MRLTKFAHSCVLVEDDAATILFCPGNYSWQTGLADPTKWKKLDRVVITHEHADHFDKDFVNAIAKNFPEAKFISTTEVVKQLKVMGIQNASPDGDELVDVQSLAHESMEPIAGPPPENILAHVLGKVTHPGDSQHLTETKEVLLLPVDAPWGSTIEAARMAISLDPKIILPVHDWMWHEEWRKVWYDRLEQFFESQGIKFLKPVDGQAIEI